LFLTNAWQCFRALSLRRIIMGGIVNLFLQSVL
jgi:hypothetical protein